MKKLRKVNTAKRKAARRQAKSLEATASLMLDHPTECVLCKAPFVRTKKNVKSWIVTVVQERVHITCPPCSKVVKEVVEVNDNGE
jgi:hypothetical protein